MRDRSGARWDRWTQRRRFVGADGITLLQAFVRLMIVDAQLRVRSFRCLVEGAQGAKQLQFADGNPVALGRAGRYARMLTIASRFPLLRARCLHQSLALHLWLRGEGSSSELRIGVRKQSQTLQAHAWAELNGAVVNDHPAAVAAFTPIFSTGAEGANPIGAATVRARSVAWS